MNTYFQKIQRAQLLLSQQRFDLAEETLRSAIAEEPDNGYAYSLLALIQAQQENYADAQQLADRGVGLDPDEDFAHYAAAQVYYSRQKFKQALAAIDEALERDPTDASYHGLKAAIFMAERKWKRAIEAAEQGLSFDPEHVECINFRAIGLRNLGEHDEAALAIDSALQQSPEDANTHANHGWLALKNSEPKKAVEHFSEALRLQPGNEWARQGMLESLKARNIFYRQVLKAQLWMTRFDDKTLMLVFIGVIIVLQVMSRLPDDGSPLQVVGILLSLGYMMFAATIWLAGPIFNLLLRLDRHGRLVLTDEERADTNYLLVALIGWAGLCSLPLISGFRIPDVISYTLLLICVSVFLSTPREAKRKQIGAITLAVWGMAFFYAYRWYFDTGVDGLTGFNPIGRLELEELLRMPIDDDEFTDFIQSQLKLSTWFTWGSVLPTWFTSYFHRLDR